MAVPDSHKNDPSSHTQKPENPLTSSAEQAQPHLESKGTFTLLLFASAQSYCDDKESLVFSAPMTLRQLFEELEREFPGIGEKVLKSSQFSVNLEYVDCTWEGAMQGKDEHVTLKARDEVGIIPPVSSG